ncbi:hypothetical protein K4P50_11005 [Staphylococcus epidermidis]|nr:hypothetical protein [Staphylococcus epidermidis]
MKLLEGRSTSIQIPFEYVQKVKRYIEPQMNYYSRPDKTGISGLVEELIYASSIKNPTSLPYKENGERVYINQKKYREFIATAKKLGYKNGLEYLKDIIDEEKSWALNYGNDKHPEENPWAIEIGGKYINLAKQSGLAVVGDSQDYKEKVMSYISMQLENNRKGNETEVYKIDGEKTLHITKDNPFEIDDSIRTVNFLDWVEKVIEKRDRFFDEIEEKRKQWLMPTIGDKGLNDDPPHSFSRVFIIIDIDNITGSIDKKINNLFRLKNKIDIHKLYVMHIHIIVKMSRNKFYDIVDGKAGDSYVNASTCFIETDGEDITLGKEVGVTITRQREIINTVGLFH